MSILFESVTGISCSHPGYTRNSSLDGKGTLFEDTFHYVCHDGFEIEGEVNSTNRVISCSANGNWNASVPNCTRKLLCLVTISLLL